MGESKWGCITLKVESEQYSKTFQKTQKNSKILQNTPNGLILFLETGTVFGGDTLMVLLIVEIMLVQKHFGIDRS